MSATLKLSFFFSLGDCHPSPLWKSLIQWTLCSQLWYLLSWSDNQQAGHFDKHCASPQSKSQDMKKKKKNKSAVKKDQWSAVILHSGAAEDHNSDAQRGTAGGAKLQES